MSRLAEVEAPWLTLLCLTLASYLPVPRVLGRTRWFSALSGRSRAAIRWELPSHPPGLVDRRRRGRPPAVTRPPGRPRPRARAGDVDDRVPTVELPADAHRAPGCGCDRRRPRGDRRRPR